MVSDRAEKCPKCGYSVRLSMEQEQEKAKQPIEIHPTMETEKNEVVNNEPQFQQKSKKKGILIAVIVALIIGCGVSYALYINNNSSSNNQPQNKPFNGSSIIRKSKFSPNPKRSVRFSSVHSKRNVQKKDLRTTQTIKPEIRAKITLFRAWLCQAQFNRQYNSIQMMFKQPY